LNSKLHAVCDGNGRPLVMLLSEGQMSDYKGAALMLSAMPKAKQLLADKGYDADWFRAALAKRRITPCIPSKATAKPRSRMTPSSTNSATESKTCSGASKTGGASTPDTTVAPIPTSRQSASPQPSYFGCDQ
jgi:transposase